MSLYTHQQQFLNENPDKSALVWSTGTGKTRTAIEWAKRGDAPTLIVCPKALKTNWTRELERWGFGQAIVVSKEEFRRDYKTLPPVEQVIVDEAHYFLGLSSQLSKSLRKYLKTHQTPRVLALTATPYMSTPYNIMILGMILGKDDYTWSYPFFANTYFTQIRLGQRVVPKVKKDAADDMAKRVAEIASVVKLEDCADVPESVFETEYVAETDEQKQAVIDHADDVNYIVRWTKIHQIMGGTLKGDEYEEGQTFASEKRERVKDYLAHKDKLIVVCRYNYEIEMLRELAEGLKRKVYVVNGAVDDKQAVLDQANADPKAVLLVNAACSEGWQAKTFDTMIFYSLDFSLKNLVQMQGRIQRIDALQKCTYIFLVVEETIDEAVYKTVVENKQEFHLKIYNEQTS